MYPVHHPLPSQKPTYRQDLHPTNNFLLCEKSNRPQVSAHVKEKKIPILMYHSISTEATPRFRPFTVPPALFAAHMMYLHQHGYIPLSVSQLIRIRFSGEDMLPARPVVITFDDGFADF